MALFLRRNSYYNDIMPKHNLTANQLPPRSPISATTGEQESPLTLGWIFAILTPTLGILMFLALRGLIGPDNFTAWGYLLLFPIAQITGATLAFLVGYASYDLVERKQQGQPIVMRAVVSTALVALPLFGGLRSLIDVRDVSNATLFLGSLVVGLAVLAVVVQAGRD